MYCLKNISWFIIEEKEYEYNGVFFGVWNFISMVPTNTGMTHGWMWYCVHLIDDWYLCQTEILNIHMNYFTYTYCNRILLIGSSESL